MKNYIIAIYSAFDNENKLYKVVANNDVEALYNALIQNTEPNYIQLILDWIKAMNEKNNTIKEIINDCLNSDMIISEPMEI